ncbi:glycine--tRNA ligase [Candidatus Curtissbacteria bacterium]|nr:glycine--tRNA ligase [Candidatus Curtissbacteria bacterium]
MVDKITNLEKIVSLAKRRGFIYPGSEIYGGLGGTWDYGPLGVELKNNIKKAFWQSMVYGRDDVVGIDTAILMNPKVWEASGHVKAFTDPLVECKICHKRFRADNVTEAKEKLKHMVFTKTSSISTNVTSWSLSQEQSEILPFIYCMDGKNKHDFKEIVENPTKDKEHNFTEPKKFNLLVEAKLGVVEDAKQKVYLRGEITQGVHVNFKNILDSTRVQIPFGIAQIGKAFRNEITPGNFTFRSREFEQMELQYYVKPEKEESEKWYEYWKNERMKWYLELGMKKDKLRFRQHEEGERAHYAKDAWDIEYDLSASGGGWKEFEGIHNRGDWDLSQHQKHSGVDMTYFEPAKNKKYLPYIIETSGGVDRAALFFLIDAYTEEPAKDEPGLQKSSKPGSGDIAKRVILKLHPKLAPFKAAVFPLLANKPDLVKKARLLYSQLSIHHLLQPVAWDDRGNIGKRYFAQDEIGTPYCITIDFETLENDTVTIRDRDTAKQERVKVDTLANILMKKFS